MNKYGELPHVLGEHKVECTEMMFYQYLPIKLLGTTFPIFEERLDCFRGILGTICCDFIGTFGLDRYVDSYVYLTAKYMFQPKDCSYNRQGWHCDGFLTDDINYIWSDISPTIFNKTEFNLSKDDRLSMGEMDEQALPENDTYYPNNSLLRLNQYNVHKVSNLEDGMRTFLKVSFSKDKYNLKGNSHNYKLNYKWDMQERKIERNIPQCNQITQKDLLS